MPYVTESNLTDLARERWSNIPDPRLREVMTALVKHVHAFVREIEPTEAEWATAIDWLTRTGKMCTDKRQEFILFSDVLGVSMLIDTINHRFDSGATPTTVEGPFHVPASPEFADGADMARNAPGVPCFVTGLVRDLDGKPIAGAMLDVWQADGEGHYEAQREVEGPWLRGVYHTEADGSFVIRTVAPIGYTIPMDGTGGELMKRTDISHYRPAHIHFAVEAPGYRGVVTHLFQRGDRYLDSDVVYAVKEPLVVDFEKLPAARRRPARRCPRSISCATISCCRKPRSARRRDNSSRRSGTPRRGSGTPDHRSIRVMGHGTIDPATGQHVVVEAARMLVSGGCIGVSTTAILSRRFQAAVHVEGRPLMYGT